MKLGKQPATGDSRDIRLAQIAAGITLPVPPARFGHGNLFHSTGWGMYGNDQYGDCVFAGGAHETILTNHLAGRFVVFNDAAVLGDYATVTGFNPDDPDTDQGTNVRQALKYRRATGLADANGARHKIGAYVALDPGDWDELAQAVYVFSAVGIGIEFPQSAMEQFDSCLNWDLVPGSPIEGGHYVPVVGRSSATVAGVITWGRRQGMTEAFYSRYCDEAWAIVFPEELRAGKTERGMDLTQLNAALKQI